MVARNGQTCAKSCERVAFQIELRRLQQATEDWHDRAVHAERQNANLRTENATQATRIAELEAVILRELTAEAERLGLYDDAALRGEGE